MSNSLLGRLVFFLAISLAYGKLFGSVISPKPAEGYAFESTIETELPFDQAVLNMVEPRSGLSEFLSKNGLSVKSPLSTFRNALNQYFHGKTDPRFSYRSMEGLGYRQYIEGTVNSGSVEVFGNRVDAGTHFFDLASLTNKSKWLEFGSKRDAYEEFKRVEIHLRNRQPPGDMLLDSRNFFDAVGLKHRRIHIHNAFPLKSFHFVHEQVKFDRDDHILMSTLVQVEAFSRINLIADMMLVIEQNRSLKASKQFVTFDEKKRMIVSKNRPKLDLPHFTEMFEYLMEVYDDSKEIDLTKPFILKAGSIAFRGLGFYDNDEYVGLEFRELPPPEKADQETLANFLNQASEFFQDPLAAFTSHDEAMLHALGVTLYVHEAEMMPWYMPSDLDSPLFDTAFYQYIGRFTSERLFRENQYSREVFLFLFDWGSHPVVRKNENLVGRIELVRLALLDDLLKADAADEKHAIVKDFLELSGLYSALWNSIEIPH